MHDPDAPSASSPDPSPACASGSLSNGSYRVLLDAQGRGFSACGPLLLTAWTADRVGDPGGLLVYLRDRTTGHWCDLGRTREGEAGAPPTLSAEPGVLLLSRSFEGIDVGMRVWVDRDGDVEVRELTLHNPSTQPRSLELTSFAEIVLHDPAAHASHPIFSKLFLQTEWVDGRALLARRRPRGADEHFPTLVHALVGAKVTGHESDRARFVGRGHVAHAPRALVVDEPLSGTVGNVLDPALSLRGTIELAPGATTTVALLLGIASDRDAARTLVGRLAGTRERATSRSHARDPELGRRAASGLAAPDAARLSFVLADVLRGTSEWRADPRILARVQGSVADLERWGLSPSAFLGLVDLDGPAGPRAFAPALALHRTARAMGLRSELAVVGGAGAEALLDDARAESDVHVLGPAPLPADDRDRLEALATWIARDAALPPATAPSPILPLPRLAESHEETDERSAPDASAESADTTEALLHPIEHGGFSADGSEYVVRMRRRADGSWSRPPRPWINVLANENFGTLCSETGAGNTWSRNSREHRLTPWSNDSVLDPHGEALYLRDGVTGDFWSPLPGPAPAGDHYEMRHGFGASVCRHLSHGLQQECTIFVPRHDALRIVIVRLRELEGRSRRLGLFDHHAIVLGPQTARGERALRTAIDRDRRVITASNGLGGDLGRGTTFLTAIVDVPTREPIEWHASGSRERFVGPGGTLQAPRVLRDHADLDGSCGAGLDPAMTQQLSFEIPALGEIRIALLFGEVVDADRLQPLLTRYSSVASTEEALADVRDFWRERCSVVHVSTPSSAIDLMLNGWLAYQTVACRLWARSAFYQSGGAFGFRDQLQDAVALVALWPEVARAQILLHASHQFEEGDVLHWWHPPYSRGLRTRFADDLLWLPHLTAHYLRVTGDVSVLEETAPFRRARPLADGEDEAFLATEESELRATIYEHCCLAIDRSLATGAHGLPLFGSGDWNDGMNRVGREGRGESTWMGFFLFTILEEWASQCAGHGDTVRVDRYREHRESLGKALETGGWDGHWYRRGYYDDGAPLGSSQSDECQIDALAQAWSVISGAATPARARAAMDAVATRLVDEEHGLVRLLDPPFVDTPHDPGYIKGYVAGVRENGGQYTHAALWVVRAFAELGDHDRAVRLLETISPVHQTRDDAQVERYQVEPYVVAADVYGVDPHVGRGGWTWYTGSAGWMIRVGLESVLGISIEDGRWLTVAPRIPDGWPGFHIRYRPFGGATVYDIEVVNPDGCPREVTTVRIDERSVRPVQGRARIELARDGRTHRVEVVLGSSDRAPAIARAAGMAS